MKLLATILFVLILCGALPRVAQAGQGEHLLSVRAHYFYSGAHGGGAALGYQWGIDDFWNVTADAGWAMDAERLQRTHLNAGVLFHFDAFTWIPYLNLSLGGYLGLPDGGEPAWAFGVAVGGGVDYRPARRWAIGVFAQQHFIVVGEVPMHTDAGVRVNIYF